MKTVLVIPCYNEERRLDVDALAAFADSGAATLLLVNDGSTDRTREVIESLNRRSSNTELLDLERNSGKAEAVRQGFVRAQMMTPDAIGFWDADLATPLAEVERFKEKLRTNPELEFVMGSRVKMMGRRIDRRTSRHYIGRVGATLISTVLGLAVYDTQCGAKLFRSNEKLGDVFSRPFLSKWIFDVEIIARYQQLYAREGKDVATAIYELPLDTWTDVEGSKVRTKDFVRAMTDLWKIRSAYK
jgi:dolichyl-phosphate beta-glucosyltransferase